MNHIILGKEEKMIELTSKARRAAQKINQAIELRLPVSARDRGAEGSLIATVLIIVVVIALAAIFREKIFDVIGRLFVRIEDGVGGF